MCKYKYACYTLLFYETHHNMGLAGRNVWLAIEIQRKT